MSVLQTDRRSRDRARYTRDRQWRMLERIAEQDPLFICWWDKARRHDEKTAPDDLMVCGLIDGTEMVHWLRSHPEWVDVGDWSDELYAAPVYITDSGLAALTTRSTYDLEPVECGLVEPGWRAGGGHGRDCHCRPHTGPGVHGPPVCGPKP